MTGVLCPCDSGHLFQACCQPFLSGSLNPQTPEQLMRSRYTAFCRGQIDYLIATHHPAKRRADDRQTLAQTLAETEWLALRVLNSTDDYASTGRGTVTFAAFYRSQGRLGQLHERSEFLRQAGRWYYLDGAILPPLPMLTSMLQCDYLF